MDIVRLAIPYEFARARLDLSWRGVHFGLESELLDPIAPTKLAVDRIDEIDTPPSALVELCTATGSERVLELVKELAASEPQVSHVNVREAWLYLVLAWIYEHRHEYPDPLQCVEEVYADFDYPERIVSFVRYMPMQGEDLGSRDANEERLFERWSRYIEETSRTYAR